MFSIEKNEILNPSWILCMRHNFGPSKRPELKYQPFAALPKQITCQMKRPQVQAYIQNNDFLKNKELDLCEKR